jgi:endonuclease III
LSIPISNWEKVVQKTLPTSILVTPEFFCQVDVKNATTTTRTASPRDGYRHYLRHGRYATAALGLENCAQEKGSVQNSGVNRVESAHQRYRNHGSFETAIRVGRHSGPVIRKIERAIYPVGFYKTKARTVKAISRRLVEDYAGKVPDTVDELLKLKGVGRKTATLVVSMGYGKPAICVDTHVHRVSNRLGLVDTPNPYKTEYALMEVLPRKHWIRYNALLVAFGQRVCTPVSPHCTTCPLRKACPRVGVVRSR